MRGDPKEELQPLCERNCHHASCSTTSLLKKRVTRDHFLRRLAEVVDFSFAYDMVRP